MKKALVCSLLLLACAARAEDAKVQIWDQDLIKNYTLPPSPWSGTQFLYFDGTGHVTVTGVDWAGCTDSIKSCQLSVKKDQVIKIHAVSNATTDPLRRFRLWGVAPGAAAPSPVATAGSTAPAPVPSSGGSNAGSSGAAGSSALAPSAAVGDGWNVVVNHTFGTGSSATIKNLDQLAAQYKNLDVWNTDGNGGNYSSHAAPMSDASVRVFTADALQLKVLPATNTQTTVSVDAHDSKSSNITLKQAFTPAQLHSKEFVFEGRFKTSKAARGWWQALWVSGNPWNSEYDIMETFWTVYANVSHPYGYHADNVFGTSDLECVWDWQKCIKRWQTRGGTTDAYLDVYHTFTWYHKPDNTYVTYVDGVEMQRGTDNWQVDLYLMLDNSFGHTKLKEQAGLVIDASELPIVMDVSFLRVFSR